MGKPLRIIVYGNAVILVLIAAYYLLWPAGTLVGLIRDPGVASSKMPRFALQWHRSLSGRMEPWARKRVASDRATQLSLQNISGTEWPVFSSVFYLWATEALEEACQNDPSLSPDKPSRYARGAIEAVAALVADPNHGAWVKQWWGPDYLHREDLFYRMLLIAGLTSYQKLLGDNRYEPMLRDQTESLAEEIDRSPFGFLDDYPGQCYPVDVLAAIASIRRADQVLGTDHSAFVERAKRAFDGRLLDSETGLPPYVIDSKTGEIQQESRGVGLVFMFCWTPALWPNSARVWYDQFDRHFWQESRWLAGIREFSTGNKLAPSWTYDVDAGPVFAGYGTAASAFGIGAARANGRYDRAYALGAEALVASWPLPNGRLFLPSVLSNLSDAPFTGEAGLLFSFTRQAPIAVGASNVHLPWSVYLGIALYLVVGLALLILAVVRAKRWEKKARKENVPASNLQLGLWLALTGIGIGGTILASNVFAALFLLAAQLLPATKRR